MTLDGDVQDGTPLLQPVMRKGRRLAPRPSLDELREHARAQVAQLPGAMQTLSPVSPYEVRISPALRALAAELDASEREPS